MDSEVATNSRTLHTLTVMGNATTDSLNTFTIAVMKTFYFLFLLFTFFTHSSMAQVNGKLWDQDQISNITVLLYQPTSDTTGIYGSGTILRQESAFFLLTASHVAITMKADAKVVFRLPGDKPKITVLSAFMTSKPFPWKIHPIADIALLELKPSTPELNKQLIDWSFPLQQIHFQKDLPSRDADLTFLGYPVIDMEMEHFSPLLFTCNLSSGLITQLRYDTNSKCNFYFLTVPSIQGCSGSGVYFSVKKGIYFGGDTTVLIGIVHGTKADNTGGKLAAVTPSYYILDLLK